MSDLTITKVTLQVGVELEVNQPHTIRGQLHCTRTGSAFSHVLLIFICTFVNSSYTQNPWHSINGPLPLCWSQWCHLGACLWWPCVFLCVYVGDLIALIQCSWVSFYQTHTCHHAVCSSLPVLGLSFCLALCSPHCSLMHVSLLFNCMLHVPVWPQLNVVQ